MSDQFESGEPSIEVSQSPMRPGDDHVSVPRRGLDNDRHARHLPTPGWRGFPLAEPSWRPGRAPSLVRAEVPGAQALVALNVMSCARWGRIADATGDPELRWRFARNARIRDECASELQEILCHADEDVPFPGMAQRAAERQARAGDLPLEGAALTRAVLELIEPEAELRRKYEELLICASPQLHAVLARQWRSCAEIHDSLPARPR